MAFSFIFLFLNGAGWLAYWVWGRNLVAWFYERRSENAWLLRLFSSYMDRPLEECFRVADDLWVTWIVWALVFFSFSFLLAFITSAGPVRRRARVVRVAILGASCLCALMTAEIAVRVYGQARYGIPFLRHIDLYSHPKLGWAGRKYFGDVNTKKFKIFVAGDSFTEGRGVPEDRLYFRQLENHAEAEVFAYAGSGYGTLQEYFVIDEHVDLIRPNLVLLQVCSNDFWDNDFRLSQRHHLQISKGRRPYWEMGEISYGAGRARADVEIFLSKHFRLYHFFASAFSRFEFRYLRGGDGGFWQRVETLPEEGQAFHEAVEITEALIRKIKQKVGEVPLVAFAADAQPLSLKTFREIFDRNNIPFIVAVPYAIRRAEAEGRDVRLSDKAHWNAEGHRLCGEILAAELVRLGYVEPAASVAHSGKD